MVDAGEAVVALFLSGALFASSFSLAVAAACYATWELAVHSWHARSPDGNSSGNATVTHVD